jgi:putative DNA primase/helicase
MKQLSEIILGHFLNNRDLIDKHSITIDFFKDQRQRLIFKELNNGDSDIALIVQKINIPNIASYLSSLLDDLPKTDEKNLPKYIAEVKKDRLRVEAAKLIEKGAKTGSFEHENIESIYQEIKNLEMAEESPELINLNEVDPKPIEWLWYNKIPSGKISLIVGDPGAGKSLLSLWMASIISRGDDWPDVKNPPIDNKGSVIILTAEDSLDDTVRVRADAMQSDVSKIKILQGIIPADKRLEFFDIKKHLKVLERAIEKTGDVKLIIFDPITAYLGDIEGNRNTQLRAALSPLAILADKYKVAIIGIHHLNKDQAKKALYRALGSVAFTATARSVWLVQLDEDDPKHQRRLFAPLKANICKDPTTLAFSINGPIGQPRVTFESMPVDTTAEELLADEETKDRMTAIEEAKHFLLEILKSGKMPSSEIEEQAKQMNIAPATLKRARTKLKTKAYQEGGQWWTELP